MLTSYKIRVPQFHLISVIAHSSTIQRNDRQGCDRVADSMHTNSGVVFLATVYNLSADTNHTFRKMFVDVGQASPCSVGTGLYAALAKTYERSQSTCGPDGPAAGCAVYRLPRQDLLSFSLSCVPGQIRVRWCFLSHALPLTLRRVLCSIRNTDKMEEGIIRVVTSCMQRYSSVYSLSRKKKRTAHTSKTKGFVYATFYVTHAQ